VGRHRNATAPGLDDGDRRGARTPGAYATIACARARIEVRREGSDELVLPRRALRRPEDTSGFGITPRTGVLVLDDLEEGAYRVTVSGSSAWAPTTVPAYVAPGRPTDVGVTLLPR